MCKIFKHFLLLLIASLSTYGYGWCWSYIPWYAACVESWGYNRPDERFNKEGTYSASMYKYMKTIDIKPGFKAVSTKSGRVLKAGRHTVNSYKGDIYFPWKIQYDDDYDAFSSICLFPHKNGLGRRFCNNGDIPNLSSRESISIPMDKGYVVQFFNKENYRGAKKQYVWGSLANIPPWAKSMKVEKNLSRYDDPDARYYLTPAKDTYLYSRQTFVDNNGKYFVRSHNQESTPLKLTLLDEGNTVTFTGNDGEKICRRSSEVKDPELACQWKVKLVKPDVFQFINLEAEQYLKLVNSGRVIISYIEDEDTYWKLRKPTQVISQEQRLLNYRKHYITTDVNAPFVPENKRKIDFDQRTSDQINRFDWTRVNFPYVAYDGSSNPEETKTLSPFYLHNLGRYPFSVSLEEMIQPDFMPESGWELVKQHMGYESDEMTPVEQKSYGMPYIILYNKKTSKLRVLVLYDFDPDLYNSAVIELRYNGRNEHVATNLFGPYSHSSLSDRSSDSVSEITQLYSNEKVQWIYADFDVGYDPCVPCFASTLTLRVSPIANGDMVLSGRLLANETPYRNSNNGLVQDDFLASYLQGEGVDMDVGALTYKNYQSLQKDVASRDTSFAKVVYESKGISDIVLKKTSQALGILSSASPEPISKSVLGSLAGVFDFANFNQPPGITGIELPPPMPSIIAGELVLRGNINFEGAVPEINIAVPGSKEANQGNFLPMRDEDVSPVYNEPLGVFTMVTIPTISLNYDGKLIGRTCTHKCSFNYMIGNFYYTINPASGYLPGDLDVFVAIEQIRDGRFESLTEFVPVEQWQKLNISYGRFVDGNLAVNLKVVVASRGRVQTNIPPLISEEGLESSNFLSIYSYPVKFFRENPFIKGGNKKLSYESFPPVEKSVEYPEKRFYIDPQDLEKSFCKSNSYKAKDVPLTDFGSIGP